MLEVESDYLFYVYSIIEADAQAEQLLEERSIPGMIPDEALFGISHQGLVAAVSRVPALQFQEEPLNDLVSDLSRLAPFAVRHEEAVSNLLACTQSLIPMAFGAVYRSPSAIIHLLDERGEEFRRLLDTLRGRREWGLKVFGDSARWKTAAEADSAEIGELDAEAAAAGPGKAYLLSKKRERLVAAESERWASRTLQHVLESLQAASDQLKLDVVPAGQTGSPKLVLKAAFLVSTSSENRFRAVAEELNSSLADKGLELHITGPWAPYSFVGESRAA